MRTILISDNNPAVLQLIRGSLEKEYRIRIAADGYQVLEQVLQGNVDMLIIGSELAGQSGLSVVKMLRREAQFKKLPIVMLADNVEEADYFSAVNAGVDTFQSKRPENLARLPRELPAIVRRIFASIDEDATEYNLQLSKE